jgi:hypothetical protein
MSQTDCHARLGQQVKVAPRQWVNVDYPHGFNPIATYIFQYRSRSEWISLTELLRCYL